MPERLLTEVSYVKDLCARYGFSLSKGFGQNFIVNPGICPKMAEAAGLGEGWGALEIGPGIGVLTRELSRRASRVVAVELDQRLFPLLDETLRGYENVTLVEGDALALDLTALVSGPLAGLRLAVCANLPYYITSPLIMKLLESRLPAETITVMVQKEAADRITAPEGSRAGGAISLAVRYYASAEKLFDVQPGSFYPPPKVVSSVIQLRPHKTPPVQVASEKALFAVIRAAFSQRRKTAVNALSSGLALDKEKVNAIVASLGLPPAVRPEQLTLAQFADLADRLLP